MNSQSKICQNCKTQFTIEAEDFDFYKKISVPPPTFCPECRLQRRLTYRNERRLYKRTCNLCRQSIIAIYPTEAVFPVYCGTCWWSDNWDSLTYGMDYNINKSFFEQFDMLSKKVPHLGMPSPSNNYNSEYTSWVDECKNCYLVFGSSRCEDTSYAELLYECKNSLDLTSCHNMELSYQSVSSKQCYHAVWCVECVNCVDCSFCFDCRGSNSCFLSTNLRNKNFYFLNQPYPKEEWKQKTKEILSSRKKFEEALATFRELVKRKAVHRFSNITQAINSSGNNLTQTKNAYDCFDSSKLEDCRYVAYGDYIKDCEDCYAIVENSQLCYEHLSTRVTAKSKFVIGGWDTNVNVNHSQYVIGCHDVLGCMAIRKKEYCVLNKQYSKEEYQILESEIIKHMNAMGENGEFFPIAMSPFAYNETLAFDYFPLTKEEAVAKGYTWRDDTGGTFGKETLTEPPDNIKDVSDDISNAILACVRCKRNYRILQKDLDFYRNLKVPMPSECSDCRYKSRLDMRTPFRLWKRKCMCPSSAFQNTISHFHTEKPCPNEFKTSYAPDRPEIIYCEKCYQAEVV